MILLLSALLAGQDDLDAKLDALADALRKDGASGVLAELLKSEHGRAAVYERIETLVAAHTARLDRDPQSPYEDWFFSRDERGAFRLRPERQRDWKTLEAQTLKAPERMAPFFKRCDAFVARIQGDGPMEKQARAGWSNPDYRAAYFNLRANELQESSPSDRLSEAIDQLDLLKGRLQDMAPLTGSYFKQAAVVKDDAARSLLVSENAVVAVLGRVLRQSYEGSEKAIAGVSVTDDGQQTVSFNLPLAELVPFLKNVEAVLAELALPLAAEKSVPARVLLAEKVLALQEAQKDVADGIFAEVVEDGFEEAGGALKVKKGRYVDDEQKDSPELLDNEMRSLIDVFRGSRSALDQLVELCADPAEAAPFANLAATFIVQEHQNTVVEEARQQLRNKAFELFQAHYLEKKGDAWAVRPERAARIDEIVKRSAELKNQ